MNDQRESDLLASVPADLLINGQWRPASGGETFAVHDPSTGAVVREVADATAQDAADAIEAAALAFPTWAATPARQRPEMLRRTFDLLTEREKHQFERHILGELGELESAMDAVVIGNHMVTRAGTAAVAHEEADAAHG